MYFFFLVIFFFLGIVLFYKMAHVLSFLIGLEMLSVYLLFLLCLLSIIHETFCFVFVFVSFSVCESVLGLVLFVNFTRILSKDYFKSLSILKF